MARKDEFIYMQSETLNQEIAISKTSGKVYCKDGTVYTPAEIEEIRKHYGELPLIIHIIKKKFGGIIVKDETTTYGPKETKIIQGQLDLN